MDDGYVLKRKTKISHISLKKNLFQKAASSCLNIAHKGIGDKKFFLKNNKTATTFFYLFVRVVSPDISLFPEEESLRLAPQVALNTIDVGGERGGGGGGGGYGFVVLGGDQLLLVQLPVANMWFRFGNRA